MCADFVLKGDICYSKDLCHLNAVKDGYLVCVEGKSAGVFERLPQQYNTLPLTDYSGKLILPGLCDLHMHAPQFSFRGLGMDLELLDWLNTHTFPEESRYASLDYARAAYRHVVEDIARGPNTRVCVFATVHLPATQLLMDMLEDSGLITMVGKVNMDRNTPEILREENADASLRDTHMWLENCRGRYKNTYPIITPRFIPSCSDELMYGLARLRRKYNIPVQSHLSENQDEIAWVRKLCPQAQSYTHAYAYFGMLDATLPTIMAHCIWCGQDEIEMLVSSGAYVAHCPQSNMNISSGIAPIRRYLRHGVKIGLGSDVAGGCHTSIFRAMSDAIQVSKMHWRLVDQSEPPLSVAEAFYLGTMGGGAFFGKVGSFDEGYEFDAIILDDGNAQTPHAFSIEDRLARAVYLSDDRNLCQKYARGLPLF